MRHSGAALSDPAAQDLATGYRTWLWWPMAFDAPYPRRQTPADFLISSAEDMSHYLLAHLNGGAYNGKQVVSPGGMAALLAPGARMGATSAYAMGWSVHDQAGLLKIEHSGDVSNFHAPSVNPPIDWLTPALLLLPLVIAVLWVAGSWVFIQRWQRRGDLPVRG
jgi:CubicO group peptidase (beta-lactamase class C family)